MSVSPRSLIFLILLRWRYWRSRFSNNSLLYPLYPLPFAKGDQIGVFFRIKQHETTKTEVLCQSRYGTIKIPPCSNIIGVEQQWSKFSIPSPSMLTSPGERNSYAKETSKQERQLLRFERGFEEISFIYIYRSIQNLSI